MGAVSVGGIWVLITCTFVRGIWGLVQGFCSHRHWIVKEQLEGWWFPGNDCRIYSSDLTDRSKFQ